MGKKKQGIWMWAPVVLLRYGVAQGVHYMNWTERTHRLCVELILAVAIFGMAAGLPSGGCWRIGASLVGAHVLNMVLNGHIWALVKHDLYWFGFYKDWTSFSQYVEKMQVRLATRRCVGMASAEVYGSLTHGAFSDSSDLDIRFVSKPGFWNGIRTCNRVTEERLRAFLLGFPLDIYMFRDSAETSRKMNTLKERPIFVYSDRDGVRLTFREAVASNQREVPA